MIKNEMKKIKIQYWCIAFFIISILLNILQLNVASGYTIENWREGANSEKIMAVNMMQKEDLDEEIKEEWQKTIDEIEYCLENDVPYNTKNMVTYASSMGGMDTFMYLVLIVCTSRIIYIEDKSKTWKNLLTTPRLHKNILMAKMNMALIITFFSIITFFAVSLTFGAVKYGTAINLIEVSYINGSPKNENSIYILIITILTFLLKSFVWEGLLFFILSLRENFDVVGITTSIILVMCGEMIADILPESIGKFLPFEALSGATTVTVHNIMPAVIILIPYLLAFWILYYISFKRTV